jgi:gluconokinase
MKAFVLMGVCGSGKSTVGSRAAAGLRWPYLEGDDFHPLANIEKMSHGIPLSDEDRIPWINALCAAINDEIAPCVIVACSALTRAVRRHLEDAVRRPVSFLHLRASRHVLAHRLRERRHFVTDALLASQLAALEAPLQALEIDADDGIEVVTARVIESMRMHAGSHCVCPASSA